MLSSGSGLEGELFGMGMWSLGLGAISAALAGLFLANTDLCLPKAGSASLEYLAETDLRSSTDGGRPSSLRQEKQSGGLFLAVLRHLRELNTRIIYLFVWSLSCFL